MTEEQQVRLTKMYGDYLKVIKPLISEIEASFEEFPIPIYNEIRAFNDHIARCYIDNRDSAYINKQLEKAEAHIERIILDCYKFLNVYYNDKLKLFNKQTRNIDLTSISNGAFYIKYGQLQQNAIAQVRKAKNQEHINGSKDFTEYQKAHNAYVELDNYLANNFTNIKWAKAKFYSKKIVALLISAGIFILGCIVSEHYSKIETFVKQLFQ